MLDKAKSQPWFNWAVGVLAAIIIILIIVFGGRWLNHHVLDNNKPKPTPANVKQLPAAPGAKSASNSDKNKTNAGSTVTGNGSAATGNGQQLANTGPGDVAAIFIVASLGAASLHYAFGARKTSRQDQ